MPTTQPVLASSTFWIPVIVAVLVAVMQDIDSYLRSQGAFDWRLLCARVIRAAIAGALTAFGVNVAIQ